MNGRSAKPESGRTAAVVGGTGMLGAPVARAFRAAGWKVRIVGRDPAKAHAKFGAGYECVRGDVENGEGLGAAFQGCEAVHLNLQGGPGRAKRERTEIEGTRQAVQAAREAGIARISMISALSAADPVTDNLSSVAKAGAEAALREGGVPWTVFRPTWFLESLPLFVMGRTALQLGAQPHPLRWLAADDYARLVVRSVDAAEAAGNHFDVVGPELFTMGEALERFAPTVGAKVRRIPMGVARWLALASFSAGLRDVAELMAYFDRTPEIADPEPTRQLLGECRTTMEQWLAGRRAVVESAARAGSTTEVGPVPASAP